MNTEATPPSPRAIIEFKPFQTGLVLLLAGSHFVHDVFTAFLAPLLPLLIEKLGLSLFLAGSLAVVLNLPSLLNPFLGSWADRGHFRRYLVILGPGFSGVLMCLIGLAPSYTSLVVLLMTAGLSVASLHVAAPVLVSEVAGDRLGRGMAFFMVAGELARTVGPLIAVQLVSSYGLEGTWRGIPVALAATVMLWWRFRDVPEPMPAKRPSSLFAVWSEMRGVLVPVMGILIARAFMIGALVTFLPTYLYGQGDSLWMATISLSILELAGAVGAFTSGTTSDWLGRRNVLFAAVGLAPLLLLAFLHVDGPLRFIVLLALGFVALSTAPVLMAVVLENAGSNPAAANGTYFMVSFVARSLITLAVGAMGDRLGLHTALLWCAGLAALGLPFVFVIPERSK